MTTVGEGQADVSHPNVESPILQDSADDDLTDDDKQYFMGVAVISAHRSKDPNTKVGACIVNIKQKRILGTGYNGMPDRGIMHNDQLFPWRRDSTNETETKRPYVCHAEMNAIVNRICADIQGCTIYTTLYPCKECSKLMVQFGITGVVYLDNKYKDRDDTKQSKELLHTYGIRTKQYTPMKHLKNRLEALSGL